MHIQGMAADNDKAPKPREFIIDSNGNSARILLDTETILRQCYHKTYTFNIMCIGKWYLCVSQVCAIFILSSVCLAECHHVGWGEKTDCGTMCSDVILSII